MRYVTHQFAHLETLERARRWLVQAGINPSRIEVHTQGLLRITVAVEAGEAAEVEQIFDVAESSDPDGTPSYWDQARQQHVYPQQPLPADGTAGAAQSESFVVGWRPLDAEQEVTQAPPRSSVRKPIAKDGIRAKSSGAESPERGERSKQASGRSGGKVAQAADDEARQTVGGLDRVLVELPEILEARGPLPDGCAGPLPRDRLPAMGHDRGDLAGQVVMGVVADHADRQETHELLAAERRHGRGFHVDQIGLRAIGAELALVDRHSG